MGNGGLSLRSVPAMLELSRRYGGNVSHDGQQVRCAALWQRLVRGAGAGSWGLPPCSLTRAVPAVHQFLQEGLLYALLTRQQPRHLAHLRCPQPCTIT